MRFTRLAAILLSVTGWALAASAQIANLSVAVEDIHNGETVPAKYALCMPTADGKSNKSGKNNRPTIRWSGAPRATQSYAVFLMDPDVPVDFSQADKPGTVIAPNARRQNFFHWAVVGIPTVVMELQGGKGDTLSAGMELPNDVNAGGYVEKPGQFGGPCPPWNDARLHHYHFIVLALDNTAPVSSPDGQDSDAPAKSANNAKNTYDRLMKSGHVVARGELIGTYTLNRNLK